MNLVLGRGVMSSAATDPLCAPKVWQAFAHDSWTSQRGQTWSGSGSCEKDARFLSRDSGDGKPKRNRVNSILVESRQRLERQVNSLMARVFVPSGMRGKQQGKASFESVAVLGKGSSLRAFVTEPQKYEALLLCNFTSRELQLAGLRDELRSHELIVLSHIGEPVISFWDLRGLLVKRVFVGRFAHELGGPRSERRRRGRLERYGLPVEFLQGSKRQQQLLAAGWHTGLTGLYLASLLTNSIGAYGLDFQMSSYAVPSEENVQKPSDRARREGESQLQRFTQLLTHMEFERLELTTVAPVAVDDVRVRIRVVRPE